MLNIKEFDFDFKTVTLSLLKNQMGNVYTDVKCKIKPKQIDILHFVLYDAMAFCSTHVG